MSDFSELIQPDRGQKAIPVHLVNKSGLDDWAKGLSAGQRAALKAQKFEASANQLGIVPDGDDWFAAVGVSDPEALSSWCLAKAAKNCLKEPIAWRMARRMPPCSAG